MRYALEGGKRVRAVICLATAEAAGVEPERALPAAAALELVHAFSLVHDDLPALDDDDERRGRPSAHVAFGEGVALLAGDALLAEAFRLVLTYPTTAPRASSPSATLGMIGGQYLDITGGRHRSRGAAPAQDGTAVRRIRRPRALGGRGARVRAGAVAAFGDELGMLFQVVDDVLDGDGYAARLGVDAARELARGAGERASAALARSRPTRRCCGAIVDGLVVRTA